MIMLERGKSIHYVSVRLWTLLLVPFLLFGQSLAASRLTMGDAIDNAGRQHMLTQRMIEAYALAGMDLKLDAHGGT